MILFIIQKFINRNKLFGKFETFLGSHMKENAL